MAHLSLDQKTELFSQLLREIEADIGTGELTHMVLKTFGKALQSFCPKNKAALKKEFTQLFSILQNTQPRFGVLNHYFQILKTYIEENPSCKKDQLLEEIHTITKTLQNSQNQLLQNTQKLEIKEKTILIHDHSHTVHVILEHFQKKKQKIQVIIAEQDMEKTQKNIEAMHQANVKFQVIPDYMISHLKENIDMAFFGGVTLQSTLNFVMDPGTYGVISQLRHMHIPCYMFIEIHKFSTWKAQPKKEMFFRSDQRDHQQKNISYERLKYSHDRVPLEMFTKIFTDQEVFTPEKLKIFYQKTCLNN